MLLFGWCITKHHEDCTVQFEWAGAPVICECACHKDNVKKGE